MPPLFVFWEAGPATPQSGRVPRRQASPAGPRLRTPSAARLAAPRPPLRRAAPDQESRPSFSQREPPKKINRCQNSTASRHAIRAPRRAPIRSRHPDLGPRLVGSAVRPGWIRLRFDWRLDAAGDGAPRGCFGGQSDRNPSLRPVLRGPAGDWGAQKPFSRRRTPCGGTRAY